jgi:hypothetical protein
MAVARIYPLGDSGLYYIHFVEGHADNDLPGRPNRPDQGLPGYGHPDQGLPGRPNRPDQGLPGYGHPDQGLPGQGQGRPGIPSNELPGTPPPTVAPGKILVLIRSAEGKWKYAALDEGYKPETLPEVPEPAPV